jgi:hypothetical protein
MIPKYLLLNFTLAVWLAACAVAWPSMYIPQGDFFEFCCRFAVWTALAQMAAFVVALSNRRSALLATQSLVIVVTFNLVFYLRSTAQQRGAENLVSLALWQVVAIVPAAVVLRWMGFRLVHGPELSVQRLVGRRQFTTRALLVWTAIAAAYCMLVRSLPRNLFDIDNAFMIAFIVVLPACLAGIAFWAALGSGEAWWRSSVPIALVICGANLATHFDDSQTFSSWEFAAVFGAPALLDWLTCLTLRAFGWRVIRRKSQTQSTAVSLPDAEPA